MPQRVPKYFVWASLAFLVACQYVGRGEFDTLTQRVEEVEARVGLSPGGLPAPVSTRNGSAGPAAPAWDDPALPQDTLPAAPPSGLRPPPGYVEPRSSPESSTYQEGQNLLKAGKYDQAARVFSRMLEENPNGRLAPNARYWLGECFYARGRFSEAADEFQRCADDYPRTDKAPDALLKLSYSYDRLGDGPRAMAALDRLLGTYPDSNAAGLIRSGRGHF